MYRETDIIPELTLDGHYLPRNQPEELAIPTVIDTGSGLSYLQGGESHQIPDNNLADETLMVRLATGSTIKVDRVSHGRLRLVSSSGAEYQNLVSLYVLPGRQLQIIMGHDLIDQFQIEIKSADRASIGADTL